MQWDSANGSIFSFKHMPEVAGVIVNNCSPARQSPVVEVDPLMESQSVVGFRQIDSSKFTLTRKINISYRPNSNRPHRPSFYRPTSPNTSSTIPDPISGQHNFTPKTDKKAVNQSHSQQFTNLLGLDIFMRHRQLDNSEHQLRLKLLKKIEKDYKQLELKKSQEVSELTNKLEQTQR